MKRTNQNETLPLELKNATNGIRIKRISFGPFVKLQRRAVRFSDTAAEFPKGVEKGQGDRTTQLATFLMRLKQ